MALVGAMIVPVAIVVDMHTRRLLLAPRGHELVIAPNVDHVLDGMLRIETGKDVIAPVTPAYRDPRLGAPLCARCRPLRAIIARDERCGKDGRI